MNKTQILLSLCSFCSLLFLAGCTSMNSKFDCPNRPGVNCRSLDQVNTMIDRGQIGREASFKGQMAGKYYPFKSGLSMASNNPQRSGEMVVRIWMAPYQDVNGNYHNESIVYSVVQRNSWAVPKEVKEP